jgi:hypothetical protein
MTYSLNIQRLALRERGEAYHVSVAQLAHRLSTSPALAALTAQRLRFLQPYFRKNVRRDRKACAWLQSVQSGTMVIKDAAVVAQHFSRWPNDATLRARQRRRWIRRAQRMANTTTPSIV